MVFVPELVGILQYMMEEFVPVSVIMLIYKMEVFVNQVQLMLAKIIPTPVQGAVAVIIAAMHRNALIPFVLIYNLNSVYCYNSPC